MPPIISCEKRLTEVFRKLFKMLEGHPHCHDARADTAVVGNLITDDGTGCGIHYEPDKALDAAYLYVSLIGSKSVTFFVRICINEGLHAEGGGLAVVSDHLM